MHRGVTHRWKTWVVAVAAVVAPSLVTLGTDTAQAAVPGGLSAASAATAVRLALVGPGADIAGSKWFGEAAINRLGSRLPDVARANGLSEAELRSHFRADATLRVDATDRLFYVEPALAAPGAAAVAITTPNVFDPAVDPANAFLLHSKPGANRVIFLDFDGQLLTGTAWNNSTGGDCTAEPYDSDGVPGSFSTAERNSMISVWRRVAEDYAAFDVDVTTEDPGYAAINRASTSDTQFGTRLIVTYSKALCPNGKTMYASICSG